MSKTNPFDSEEFEDFQPIQNLNTYQDAIKETKFDPEEFSKEEFGAERNFTFRKSRVVNVFDVAAYILKKTGPISSIKLQKLVYYCQAWSLVWDEKPLFPEDIEAWANGPVVRDLFNYHRGQFTVREIAIGDPTVLSEQQSETIDAVLDYYGEKSAQWLVDLSHMEKPWQTARRGIPENAPGAYIISHSTIAEYYSSLK